MIDPFVSLFMRPEDRDHTHNDAATQITVEEAIDCRNSNSRLFSLLDKRSLLSIIINDNSTLTSCNLAGHEIVVDTSRQRHEAHETWAVGDRPFQKLSSLPWTSHVRGAELILSSSASAAGGPASGTHSSGATISSNNSSGSSSSSNNNNNNNNNPHTTLHFELSPANELHCLAKLKTIHLQHQVFYYNLNQANEGTPIAGHSIVVRCNGNLNRIRVQPTKLLCHCNKSAPLAPNLLIGEIPFELSARHPENPNPDDPILCDAIYCLESTGGTQDYLQAQLQYLNRVLTFEVRAVKLPAASHQVHTHAGSVSSSSGSTSSPAGPSESLSSTYDLKRLQGIALYPKLGARGNLPPTTAPVPAFDDLVASSSSSGASTLGSGARVKLEPLDSTSSNRSTCASDVTTSHQQSTMLRLRVRVTNFGVSILPIMMTNYATRLIFNVL